MVEEHAKGIQRDYYSGMVKPTNQETISNEKIACYSQVPKREGTLHRTRPHREAPGLVRRQWEQEKMQAIAFILVSMGRNGQDNVNGFWIV